MAALASVLLVAASLLPPATALSSVMPPENQWAVEGQGLTLECRSDRPFDTCQWAPPGEDTYVVERGFSAEGGRLVYHEGDDKDTVCAVRITAAAEKDGGKWKCIVAGTDAEGQIQRVSALADVRLATKPSSVTLAHPFHAGHANVSAGATVPVRCSVAGALPAPTAFEWYVGDDEVTGQYETVDDEEAQWAQTLLYTPDRAHANKSLRCKVGHMALQDGDDREAGVVLRLVGGDAADFGSSSVASQSFHEEPYFPVLMVVIVVVLSAVLGLAIYFKCIRPRSVPAATDKDAEAQKGEEIKENNDDETKVNNPEEVLNASAASKKSAASAAKEEIKGRAAAFTERVASFFRFGAAGKDEGSSEKGVEKAGDEFVAVDINGGKAVEEEKEGEGKTDATVDGDAKEEAEGEQEEDNPAAEAATKAGFFRKVLGAFRSAGGKKEEVKMEDTEETAGESEEAGSEKKDEEKPVQEKESDQPVPTAEEEVKKQPPKNTDV